MSRKNKIAFVLVCLFGILAIWLVLNNKKATIRQELRDFAVADTGSITKIFLADRSNNVVTLQKIKPGVWKANDKFFARNDAVNTLLYTIKMLAVKQPVGKNARENVIKDLATRSTKVEIYQNEKLTKVYYVGGETKDHLGTYMLLSDPETGENSSVPFVICIPGFDGFLTTRYFTSLTDWRGRVVFEHAPPQIRSIKVEFMEKPESSFQITLLEKNKFELRQLISNSLPMDCDTSAIKQYITYYQKINFETLLNDVFDKSKKDSILSQPVIFSIQLTDIDGNVNDVKMYHKPAEAGVVGVDGKSLVYDLDRMYASINKGQDLVAVQYYVFGKLLQPIDYFFYHNKKN